MAPFLKEPVRLYHWHISSDQGRESYLFYMTLYKKSLLNTLPSTYDRKAADTDFSFAMLELLCPIFVGIFYTNSKFFNEFESHDSIFMREFLLTTDMFDVMSADDSIGRSQALQMSMVDLMID